MSLISWPRRREQTRVVYPETDIRLPFNLPPDLERDLAAALDEPFGAPQRTARTIEAELVHLRDELAHARELVKQGEVKEADLTAELTKAVDEEIAAKKATHDTEVAALENLRPATGEQA
jgi:hypothetical protein